MTESDVIRDYYWDTLRAQRVVNLGYMVNAMSNRVAMRLGRMTNTKLSLTSWLPRRSWHPGLRFVSLQPPEVRSVFGHDRVRGYCPIKYFSSRGGRSSLGSGLY